MVALESDSEVESDPEVEEDDETDPEAHLMPCISQIPLKPIAFTHQLNPRASRGLKSIAIMYVGSQLLAFGSIYFKNLW